MKEWKTDLVKRIVKKAEGEKIISLRETALEAGINHIKTQECLEITRAVLKVCPDYQVVKMINPANKVESAFTTITFIDKDLEFESEEEFLRGTTSEQNIK